MRYNNTNYIRMNSLEKIKSWGDDHNPKWLGFFRIALGLLLIWKGIEFIINLDVLATFLREADLADKIGASVSITLIADIIISLHLIGGFCIALGVRTRLFCLFNLPVLIGAVFLVNLKDNLLKPYSGLWLSLIVLLALIGFLIEGNGQFAVETEKGEALDW
ncbi:MAG: DoxX family protein [Mucilaginibacter sp.]